jgi:TM2 domain-containing membrane protein YozV
MNKYELQGRVKSTGTAFLFWFLLGAHFAYLGKWGLQIIFWLTLGGLGIWALVELFLISGRVQEYNASIYQQLDQIDKQEKSDDLARNLAIIEAAKKQ